MSPHRVHILRCCDAEHHTYISKEGCNDNALDDDKPQDRPRLGTNSLAYTKLVCTFLHRDKHDVGHTHDARQQGKEAHNPQSRVDDVRSRVELQVLCKSVPYPYRVLVIGCRPMIAVYTGTIGSLKLLVILLRLQSVEGEDDVASLVATVVYRAERAEGDERHIVHPALVAIVNTYNGESQVVHLHHTSVKVKRGMRHKLLSQSLRHDDGLAPLLNIQCIKKASA